MIYKTEHFENRAGGKGWIHIEHLVPEETKGDHGQDVCAGHDRFRMPASASINMRETAKAMRSSTAEAVMMMGNAAMKSPQETTHGPLPGHHMASRTSRMNRSSSSPWCSALKTCPHMSFFIGSQWLSEACRATADQVVKQHAPARWDRRGTPSCLYGIARRCRPWDRWCSWRLWRPAPSSMASVPIASAWIMRTSPSHELFTVKMKGALAKREGSSIHETSPPWALDHFAETAQSAAILHRRADHRLSFWIRSSQLCLHEHDGSFVLTKRLQCLRAIAPQCADGFLDFQDIADRIAQGHVHV